MRSCGRILPVEVDTILTMDDPRYCPAKLEELYQNMDTKEHIRFSPKVRDFVVTPEYINFLRSIANYLGKNPNQVHAVNMSAILDSSKYLNKSE